VRFTTSLEQQQFAATLHDALSRPDKPDLTALGVTALAVPAEHGGLDADPVDLVVAFEELGHHAVPGPLVESIAAVPTLLAALNLPDWLPALAEGDLVATLTLPPHLPLADTSADLVLHVEDGTLWSATLTGPELSSVDPSRTLRAVRQEAVLAHGIHDVMARAFELGTLACAAQTLGAGRAMLELTTAYAKQRTQFGRPIGAFQAVKHHLAGALVALELARPLVHAAALSLTTRDVSAAKIAATEAAHRAGRVALQVHGAIGYTLEYELSRWLLKVQALRSTWGTLRWHRDRVMTALTPPGGSM
jgi:alkylation response protein AidB-like acyl-CoA dehydrogenase